MLANLPFQVSHKERQQQQHLMINQGSNNSEDKLLLKIVSLAQMIVMKKPDSGYSPSQGIAVCGSSSRRLIFLLAAYHRISLALPPSLIVDHTRIIDLLSLLCKCTLNQARKLLENSSLKSSESNWIFPLLTKIHQKEKRKFFQKWRDFLHSRKPMPPKSSWSELDDEDILPSLKPLTSISHIAQKQQPYFPHSNDLSITPRSLSTEDKKKYFSHWRLCLRSLQLSKYSKINQLERCFQIWRQFGPLHHRFTQYTSAEPYHPYHSLDDNVSILSTLPPPFNKNLNLISFAVALDINSFNRNGKAKFSSQRLIISLSRFLLREWRALQRLLRVERELEKYRRLPILKELFSKWRKSCNSTNLYQNFNNYDEIVHNRHTRMFLLDLLNRWRIASREKYYREMDSLNYFILLRKDSLFIVWKKALKNRRVVIRSLKIWRTLPSYHLDREEQAIQFWKERCTSKIFLSWRTNNSISASMMGAAKKWDEKMSCKKMMFMLMVWREMLKWVNKTLLKVDQFHSKKLIKQSFIGWKEKLSKRKEEHNSKISFLGKWRFATLKGRFRRKTIEGEKKTVLNIWLSELGRIRALNQFKCTKDEELKKRIVQAWRLHQLISKIDRYKCNGKRLFLYKWRIVLISLHNRQKKLQEMSSSCKKVQKSRFFTAWQNRFQNEMISLNLLKNQYASYMEERRRRFMMLWKLQTLTRITLRIKEMEKKSFVLFAWKAFSSNCEKKRNERIKKSFLMKWRQSSHQCLAVEFDDERGRKLISTIIRWWKEAAKLQVQSHRKSMEWISSNLCRFHFQRWRMETALRTYNRT